MASISKRRRRVLGASCILAALIVAGSSFAWFTSKDEVTNRLTATADYGVTIAEDFTPPNNWVPGQKVDKNVGVVNTGNVDAFVRAWLEGEMRVVNETSEAKATWDATNKKFVNSTDDIIVNANQLQTALVPVTDESLKALNLNYITTISSVDYYLRELTKTKRDNPTPNGSTGGDANDNNPDAYSEVMAIQAGGELVYTTGTKFKFTPNQSLTVHDDQNAIQNIVKDTNYTVTVDSTAARTIAVSGTAITVNDIKYLPSIDSDSFVPATPGLYIFKRNSALKDTFASSTSADQDDMEFTGYFYAASVADETSGTPGSGAYLALHNGVATSDTDRSDYTLPSGAITATYSSSANTWTYVPSATLQLFTAERKTYQNNELKWTYTAPVAAVAESGTPGDSGYVAAQPAKQGFLQAQVTDGPKVNVYLANILGTDSIAPTGTSGKDAGLEYATAATDAESWTPIFTTRSANDTWGAADSVQYTFYYNNDVEEGCTTERLVDSVELDKEVTQSAYMSFDFDLNVKMESVQVTVGEDGKEGVVTVAPWAATDSNTSNPGTDNIGATGTAAYTDNEINKITWAAP